MPRPAINLHQMIRAVLQHTSPLLPESQCPIQQFEASANVGLILLKYLERHIDPQTVYQAVYDRHLGHLRRQEKKGSGVFSGLISGKKDSCVPFFSPASHLFTRIEAPSLLLAWMDAPLRSASCCSGVSGILSVTFLSLTVASTIRAVPPAISTAPTILAAGWGIRTTTAPAPASAWPTPFWTFLFPQPADVNRTSSPAKRHPVTRSTCAFIVAPSSNTLVKQSSAKCCQSEAS